MESSWRPRRRFKPTREELERMMAESQFIRFERGVPAYIENRVKGMAWRLDHETGEYEELERGGG